MSEETTSVETEAASVSGEAGTSEVQDQEVDTRQGAAEEGGEPSESQEESAEEKGGEEKEKGPKKLTANERIQQLISENKGLKEKLEKNEPLKATEFDQLAEGQPAPPEPPRHPGEIDYEKLNAYMEETARKIEDLKDEGRFLDASRLEDDLGAIKADLKKHETAVKDFETRSESLKADQQAQKKLLDGLNTAAENLRNHYQVPGDLWNQMGVWFAQKCSEDKVLGQKFSERLTLHGPTEAVDWAYGYIREHMAADLEKAVAKKETGKGNMQGVHGSQAGDDAFSTVKTYDDLQKLSSKKILEFKKASPKRFQAIMDKALGS